MALGVLVAISIPIFSNQLEKAREATDLANIRSAYAECSAAVLTGDSDTTNGVNYKKANGDTPAQATKNVTLTQKKKGWQTETTTEVGGKALSSLTYKEPTSGATVTVTVNGDGTWDLTAAGAAGGNTEG